MDNNQTITTSDKVAVTFTLPNPKAEAVKLKNKIIQLFSVVYNPIRNQASETGTAITSRARRLRMPKFNFDGFDKKKTFKILFPLIIGIVVIGGIVAFIKSIPDAQSTPVIEQSLTTSGPLYTETIEKIMNFPLRDNKAKEIGKFEYAIKNAEIRNQIIVQGRTATAIKGRVFLIFNLKITNNLDQPLQINTRDYLRIIVASNKAEKLAADIHSDPVEVQAISTKYSRVGLAIDEKELNSPITLQIGEIDGAKEIVELKFK